MILMSTKHDELENGFFHADAFESLGHFNPEALSGGQGSQRVFHANLNTWRVDAMLPTRTGILIVTLQGPRCFGKSE